MKGAIFDVDGTLLDSMPVWWRVSERFFENHSIKADKGLFEKYREMRLEDSLPQIREQFKLDMTAEEMILEYQRLAFEEYRDRIQLKPHAGEYMKKLHREGVKIALATSGYKELCKSAFLRLGVWDLVDACAFSDETGVDKSHPDVYLLAAERIGAEPSECVVFEDIAMGIEGAKKGGFKTCAVYDESNRGDTEILKQIADRYIKNWNELI